jgi:hypothetical protein
MFGTAFIPDQNEWPDTGIADHSEPRSVWDYVVHPISYVRNSSRIGLSDQVLGSAMPSEAPNSNGVI